MLMGLLNAPERNPEAAKPKENVVLDGRSFEEVAASLKNKAPKAKAE